MNLVRKVIDDEKTRFTTPGEVIRAALSQFLEDPSDPLETEMKSFEETRRRLHQNVDRLTEKTQRTHEKD